ncbi:hypothetical protein HGRIS_008004 [Hohenbuehelia grisea]|uniref:RING-CH-type domain-containing protein n=1 Tax=Hohenbuehelia grisea TaxID=104357 RepID=A0ABR3J6M4_9AGAR
MPTNDEPATGADEKQCRICFDSVDAESELGRLIRPCLCMGSISYVHVKCLQRWRNTSQSQSAFFRCPQCHYQYRFARTQVLGIATNPVVVGAISSVLFTVLVLLSSFVTTFFMSWFEEPSYGGWYFYYSPFDIARDLIRAALRIISDETGADLFDEALRKTASTRRVPTDIPFPSPAKRSLLKKFVRRFLLGLPIVGASSVVQMLLSAPFIGPVHWLARYRGSRRRDNSRDIAAFIIMALLLWGSLRDAERSTKSTN